METKDHQTLIEHLVEHIQVTDGFDFRVFSRSQIADAINFGSHVGVGVKIIVHQRRKNGDVVVHRFYLDENHKWHWFTDGAIRNPRTSTYIACDMETYMTPVELKRHVSTMPRTFLGLA
jgi:hypothetical protein